MVIPFPSVLDLCDTVLGVWLVGPLFLLFQSLGVSFLEAEDDAVVVVEEVGLAFVPVAVAVAVAVGSVLVEDMAVEEGCFPVLVILGEVGEQVMVL